jgi:hypothetical protein
MSWYKDRDFPEVKASNADIVAVIRNPKQLQRVIDEYNNLEAQLAEAQINKAVYEAVCSKLDQQNARNAQLEAALEEALYQLERIRDADWNNDQKWLGAKSGAYQVRKAMEAALTTPSPLESVRDAQSAIRQMVFDVDQVRAGYIDVNLVRTLSGITALAALNKEFGEVGG